MSSIQADDLRFAGEGEVIPPVDMIEAARLSLSEAAFNDLMNQLGHLPPTPAQLCAAAHLERTRT